MTDVSSSCSIKREIVMDNSLPKQDKRFKSLARGRITKCGADEAQLVTSAQRVGHRDQNVKVSGR
jgi:hypothetical protein